MNIIMFIVGGGIFTSFIIGIVLEVKNEKPSQSQNYEHFGGEGCNPPIHKKK
tara:strand:- start:180 stop:335 length:156 start_codon:yes stop_codon:yes gene_type:complete